MATRLSVEYTMDGKTAYNTGFITHLATTTAEFQDVADNIATNWAANIMPSLSFDLSLGPVTLTDIDSPVEVVSSAGAGTMGGQQRYAESILSAVVITKRDSTSRRTGRWFVPGVPDERVTSGAVVDPTWAANLAAQFQVSQLNMLPVFGAQFANCHKTNTLPGAAVFAPVESFSFNPILGSQRRRRF